MAKSDAPLPESNRVSIVALISDAYGGYGGIARFNRDFLAAVAGSRTTSRLSVVARSGVLPARNELPDNADYRVAPRFGKAGFVLYALFIAIRLRPKLLVIGHINLCFLGALVARLSGSKTLLVVHGGEAWRPRRSRLVNWSIARVNYIVGVSQLTLDRLATWAPIDRRKQFVLPCCVDTDLFKPGPANTALRDAIGLSGKRVIMTLGRLAAEEQAKGFDEVIALMPRLIAAVPNLVYLICGKGTDEARLRHKAEALGVAQHVIFAGYVPEDTKANYYRLADAYVMPSRGEGFGIVILEALACGTPVIASSVDGTAEALMNGKLGACIDPRDPDALLGAILDVLRARPAAGQPPELSYFSIDTFNARVADLLEQRG